MRYHIALAVLAGVDLQRDAIAGTHEVAVDEIAVQAEFLRFGVADAAAELPGQAFLDVEIHVDEIRAARDRLVLDLPLLDIRQPLNALLGALDRRIRQPSAFELAHLAAQRLVVDRSDVVEVDVPDVHAVAGFDEERERHGLLVVVRGGHRIDLGECIAVGAEPVAHQLLRTGDDLAREDVARVDLQQFPQLLFGHHHRPRELDLRHLENVAFVDVHGDVHVVFFRSDGDLRRLDLEIGVAPVHVVGAQLLEVAGQGLARVAVILLVPRQPIRGFQLESAEHVLLFEGGVADQVYHLDLGALAFLDVDENIDLVARQLGDLRIDAHGILAAAEVLVGQILLHLVEDRTVEGLALREADVAQTLLQVLGLDVLVALDLELGDRGPLDHHDQQGVAVAAQFHVAEEPGRVQSTHRLADALAIQVIADVHRQIIEYRAFGDALQSFDADVADGKRILRRLRTHDGPQGLDGKRHQASQTQFKPHATTTDCYFYRS